MSETITNLAPSAPVASPSLASPATWTRDTLIARLTEKLELSFGKYPALAAPLASFHTASGDWYLREVLTHAFKLPRYVVADIIATSVTIADLQHKLIDLLAPQDSAAPLFIADPATTEPRRREDTKTTEELIDNATPKQLANLLALGISTTENTDICEGA